MTTNAPSITVVGSVNLDLVASCRAFPRPGETVAATGFSRSPGGKGANQALAARRLGAEVALRAGVGDDALAAEALALLEAAGVDLSGIKVVAGESTGIALITVDEVGENVIVVVPGANGKLLSDDLPDLNTDGVICQLEVPVATVEAAARRASGLFCLNAAPSVTVPASLLDRADVIVVNEEERAALGDSLDGSEALVVVTLGARGAVAHRRGQQVAKAAAPVVATVDTVGAGDTFVAALMVRLLEGASVQDALEAGCMAGALATTAHGAQPALPSRAQVDEGLERWDRSVVEA